MWKLTFFTLFNTICSSTFLLAYLFTCFCWNVRLQALFIILFIILPSEARKFPIHRRYSMHSLCYSFALALMCFLFLFWCCPENFFLFLYSSIYLSLILNVVHRVFKVNSTNYFCLLDTFIDYLDCICVTYAQT